MIVGPELKQTRAIVNPRIKMLTQDAPEGMVTYLRSEDTWFIGTSRIILGGFDVKNATRQRGKSLYKIYIEEIVDSNPDDYTEAIRSDLGPALTHSKHAQIIYLTTLPKVEDHPFIIETIPEAKFYDAFYSFTIHDNVQLTKEQYNKCVRLCGGEETIEFRREYLNEMVRDAGRVVIPSFNEMFHVKQIIALPQRKTWYTTIDFGGTKDKTAALLHTYDFYNDLDIFWDERIFDANTPTDYIMAEIERMERAHEATTERIADCPGQIQVDLSSVGYEIRLPPKLDWQAGVNQMSVRFANRKVVIHDRCKFLIASARSGSFNKQRDDFERTKLLGHCDALAAMMYALRVRNTESPYNDGHRGYSDNMFYRPKENETINKDLSSVIASHTIANDFNGKYTKKRFGRFK